MTPATDGANAPPGNSRFEAIASSTLTGRFFGVPFFQTVGDMSHLPDHFLH